jgi:serine/threonine protein kinase
LAEPVDGTQKIKRRNSILPAARQLANSPRPEAEHKGQIVSQTVTQYGRHGDINPGNILWFKDSDSVPGELKGTMKLADFGQAELNSLKSRTSPRNVAHTLTYRPPECDRIPGYEALPIRQTYDMWCLGCVFLEFVTWMLGGEALLNDFSNMRLLPDHFTPTSYTDAFFEVRRNDRTERDEFRVKEAVYQVSSHGLSILEVPR